MTAKWGSKCPVEIEKTLECILSFFFFSYLFIKPARKPQAFKPGDEWRPERSVGDPAKPGGPKETLDFSPGSFIFYIEIIYNNIK